MAIMLSDTKQVIEALGGRKAVQALTGAGYKTVWNWANGPTFPRGMYVTMIRALERCGQTAPPSLWRQGDTAQRQAARTPRRTRQGATAS